MLKHRIFAVALLLVGAGVGWFALDAEGRFPYKLGLDLAGGTHLTYRADTSRVDDSEISEAMRSLKEVIERRVNIFGVSEPLVQTETGRGPAGAEHRLIVELPGVTDVKLAVESIGKTPQLDFRIIPQNASSSAIVNDAALSGTSSAVASIAIPTGIDGSLVKKAQLNFGQSRTPGILVEYNEEGTKLLSDITAKHIGDYMAIFLDGRMISAPVIREAITDGAAQITGEFTADEARSLVRDVNFGALPLPIELIETQTVGPSLGADTVARSINALMWALVAVAIYLVVWYRTKGAIAAVALLLYAGIVLSLFKLIPVTLTAAGIAGFILSLGMAVDANVLIFERMREEKERGKNKIDAIREGFARAWPSIRDGNATSIISAIVLYTVSGTSLVKGFALVFLIGILVSMFTAVVVTRTFLFALTRMNANR